MKAIDYVVRDSDGAVDREQIPEGSQSTNIKLDGGQEVSLNLRQVDVAGYQRDGDNLVVELADGRVIVLEDYFEGDDVNALYLSSEGFLNEVAFVETADGAVFGQYGPTQQWGKWSPSDDLIFLGRTELAGGTGDEDVSMLAAALLGGGGAIGAGALGVAAVAGLAGGGGGGEAAPRGPFVDGAGERLTVDGNIPDPIITITGGGEPGDTVDVTIGEMTQSTEIDEDGTFEVVFEGHTFPEDGDYAVIAAVTNPDGDQTLLDGPGYLIDTVPPEVQVETGTVSVGDQVNADGYADGVELTGTGEPGATVSAVIEGEARTTTVDEDGSWGLVWEFGVLPEGEYTTDVEITTTDPLGNAYVTNDQLAVDTVNTVTINDGAIETDGVINVTERADGVTVTGTSQPGAQVDVTLGTVGRTATTDGNGDWSVGYDATDIPQGEVDATITAVATDPAGNTSTATGSVAIDTTVDPFSIDGTPAGGGDWVISDNEIGSGLILSGSVEPGSAVEVQFGSSTQTATVAADGSWTASFPPSAIPAGEYTETMVATATDGAGNVSSLTRDVTVDTVGNALTINSPIEGDDVVNEAEASDGVILSGSSQPGALVYVTMAGETREAVTDTNGAWQAFFDAGSVPAGTYDATILATTTDAAGNQSSASDTVRVDTTVDNFGLTGDAVEGDSVISGADYADGILVTGTVEPGSTVMVTMGAASMAATVDASGGWSALFATSDVPGGEYTGDVTVVATDAAGNTANLVEGVTVDTLVNELSIASADINAITAPGGAINAAEASDGVNFGGQVEPGSVVMVDFNGTMVPATVSADGRWDVSIPASAIAGGTYDAQITVTATDAVGNTEQISQIVSVDTEAPDGPIIAAFTRDTDGLRSISTEGENTNTDIAAVMDNGTINDAPSQDAYIAPFNETLHAFSGEVPDGTDLIVTNVDTAGNMASTYLAMDDETPNSTVEVSNPLLGDYQIEAVDLQFAEAATLTLTEAQITDLSSNTDELTVIGGSDDTVQVAGATQTGTTTKNGQDYDVYSVGDATLIIDSDITVEEPPVI